MKCAIQSGVNAMVNSNLPCKNIFELGHNNNRGFRLLFLNHEGTKLVNHPTNALSLSQIVFLSLQVGFRPQLYRKNKKYYQQGFYKHVLEILWEMKSMHHAVSLQMAQS